MQLGNFVAVVTEGSSDMSRGVLEPHLTASQNMAMPARNAPAPEVCQAMSSLRVEGTGNAG